MVAVAEDTLPATAGNLTATFARKAFVGAASDYALVVAWSPPDNTSSAWECYLAVDLGRTLPISKCLLVEWVRLLRVCSAGI